MGPARGSVEHNEASTGLSGAKGPWALVGAPNAATISYFGNAFQFIHKALKLQISAVCRQY